MKISKTVEFEVICDRKMLNPYQYMRKATPTANCEMHHIYCDVKHLPMNIPMKTNPREQNLKTRVARKIEDSLVTGDSDFFLLNRGLLISAKSCEYNVTKGTVKILMEDDEVHGIVDGGHTYKIIQGKHSKIENDPQFVKIEVLTGIEELFQDIAAARNTSVQVQDKSIAELENKFDIIKEALSGASYENDVAYKENEDKEIYIEDMLAILTMFNMIRFFDDSKHPTVAYSTKSKCVQYYLEDYEKGESNPYVKMRKVMQTILSAYDHLEKEIGNYYRQARNEGRYGSTKGVVTRSKKNNPKSFFSRTEIEYQSPKAFIMPIIGALRALLIEDNGEYRFVIDPIRVLDELGPDMVRLTVECSRSLGNNPNAVGKYGNHWAQLYDKVRILRYQNQI